MPFSLCLICLIVMNNLLFSFSSLDNLILSIHNSIGIWYYIIFNFFGILAVAFRVTEFQLKSRSKRLVCSIGSYISWIFYFALQYGYTTSLVSLVCAIQCLIFLQRDKHKWAKSIAWLFLFLALQVGISITSLRNWYDIFSVLAGICSTIGYFVLSEKKYRFILLCSLISWVLSSAFNMYIVALCADLSSTTSAVIGIVRYYKYHNKSNTANEIQS